MRHRICAIAVLASLGSLFAIELSAQSNNPEDKRKNTVAEITARCRLILELGDPEPEVGLALILRILDQQGAERAAIEDGIQPDCRLRFPVGRSRGVAVGNGERKQEVLLTGRGIVSGREELRAPARGAATTYLDAFFPWPPPEPYTSEARRKSEFPGVERVGQLTDTIQKSLRGAGYSGVRFFGVGSDGVALVTDLEQTDEAGRPVTGERWVPLMQEPRTSDWREYIINLFHRPRGHFRVFTFIITPRELYYDPTKTIDEAVVKEWQKRGSMILPSRLGQLPLSDAYKVYILVYQFVKEEGQIPKVVKGDPVSNLLKLAGIKLIRGQQ